MKAPLTTRFACLLSISLLTACVTVNVNFPESTVQKATDDYVRDLYRAKEKTQPQAPAPGPSAGPVAERPWSFFPEALADEAPNFRIGTSRALNIKERLRSRVKDVIAQKSSGVLGETQDGLLVIKDKSKIKPLLQKKIEKLVSDENSDRQALYDEIVSANQLPTARRKDVALSFARSFQAESPSGTWVQSATGAWTRKP
jgi:uncharacterized protein YdbL (DUF1318 family)